MFKKLEIYFAPSSKCFTCYRIWNPQGLWEDSNSTTAVGFCTQ